MKRPGYREAIDWLAGNDDCYWLADSDAYGRILSVSAAMVRDLYGVEEKKLFSDIRRALKRINPNHPAVDGIDHAIP